MRETSTEMEMQTVLLLRKLSNIHFSFCVAVRKKDADITTRLFSILGLNICTGIENINSSSQEVYFNIYNVVYYIYAHSEKERIYKFC